MTVFTNLMISDEARVKHHGFDGLFRVGGELELGRKKRLEEVRPDALPKVLVEVVESLERVADVGNVLLSDAFEDRRVHGALFLLFGIVWRRWRGEQLSIQWRAFERVNYIVPHVMAMFRHLLPKSLYLRLIVR